MMKYGEILYTGQDIEILFEWARRVGDLSTCRRRKVGAVLVGFDGNIFSVGFNKEPGLLRCDQGQCPRGMKSFEEKSSYASYDDCSAIHAEEMALAFDIEGEEEVAPGLLLIVTDTPCDRCYALCASRSMRVLWPQKAKDLYGIDINLA